MWKRLQLNWVEFEILVLIITGSGLIKSTYLRKPPEKNVFFLT